MDAIREYFDEITYHLSRSDFNLWNSAGNLLMWALNENKKVWIAGNGGNLANSLHFATDWSKGLYYFTGKKLDSISLSDNSAMASAFANDLGFENQFSEQLKMNSKPDEVVVLMTAGGKSRNIIQAAEQAKRLNLKTIGLTGGEDLQVKNMFDIHIHINSNNIQLVEDIHAIFGHAMLKHIVNCLARESKLD